MSLLPAAIIYAAAGLTFLAVIADECDIESARQFGVWILIGLLWPVVVAVALLHACWSHCRRVVG